MDRRKLLIIAAIIIVVIILILAFGLKKDRKSEPITLKFWSVYDDKVNYSEAIEEYQKANKHVTINYEKKSFAEYEQELINALAAGEGPDIFTIHHTWLSKHEDKIFPMPQEGEDFYSAETFKNTFVDVTYQDLVKDGRIYALPLYVDTLALYYNKDFFNSSGIPSVPETWDEFLDDVEVLTGKDSGGNIERAGAAIGTAENVNRSTDILALLMLQTGAEMTNADNTQATFNQRVSLEGESFMPGKDALRFYTDFSNPTKRVYCWNRQMPYSIDAFYEGKTAMMINYSYHIDTIRAKSPYLNFDVASMPQIKNRNFDVNYANYWAQTVSKNSDKTDEAWKFLVFLAKKENAQKYLEKSKRPTARRDLVEWQRENADIDVFANQSLTARSWHQADNQSIEKILADMIKSVVLGEADLEEAVNKAASQVTLLMR